MMEGQRRGEMRGGRGRKEERKRKEESDRGRWYSE